MKIILRILAVGCLLWALLPVLIVAATFFSGRPVGLDFDPTAIKDADQILARSGDPRQRDDKPLTITRDTLIILTDQARLQATGSNQNRFETVIWISSAFALVAGVSLFALSRKPINAPTDA